jgi:hypothetical protein
MEAMRWLFDVNPGMDEYAGGLGTEITTDTSPLTAEVVGGMCCTPNQSVLTLGIQNGIAYCVDPDASPTTDDSVYKFVQTTGQASVCTQTIGAAPLTMAANPGGSPRIDVIECTRIQDPNPETDSRDIFNPTTGLFTASTVTKTTDSVFQYRVRQGTVGGGWPGTATGYLPLMVAFVPAGAATNDDMTFWDVRPLIQDRVFGTAPLNRMLPRRVTLDYTEPVTGDHVVQGIAEVELGQRRLGGVLLGTCPDSDERDAGVDFTDAQNQMAGMSLPAGTATLVYYYFCTPFGLPRWAMMTNGYPKVPRPPRGLTVLSTTAPDITGAALAAIPLPTAYGFGGGASAQTNETMCWGVTTCESSLLQQAPTKDRQQWLTAHVSALTATASSPFKTGTFSVADNTIWPAGAKAVYLRLLVELTLTSAAGLATFIPELFIDLGSPDLQGVIRQGDAIVINTDGSPETAITLQFRLDLPLQNRWPVSNAPQTYTLTYNLFTFPTSLPASIVITAAPTLICEGWKF